MREVSTSSWFKHCVVLYLERLHFHMTTSSLDPNGSGLKETIPNFSFNPPMAWISYLYPSKPYLRPSYANLIFYAYIVGLIL